jgi:3-hydroxyisobutyrate dehydrogenase
MSSQDAKPSMPRVAVIGAGTMGGAMATRLLSSHFEVRVWSRHASSTLPLVELGASGHADVREAVAGADVLLTTLPTAAATTDVMFGMSGLDAAISGAAWVQMATIGVGGTESIYDMARKRRPDVAFVDAPVSGSREPAAAGQLLILAAGTDPAPPGLESVFDVLGRKTLWLGPVGAGSRMKLILNTWLAFQVECAAESASLANRLQIDPQLLVEALHDNPLASPYAMSKLDRMLRHDFHSDFSLDWALKDLDLVEADAGADAAPIAAAIAHRWLNLVENGSSGLDVSAAAQGLADR